MFGKCTVEGTAKPATSPRIHNRPTRAAHCNFASAPPITARSAGEREFDPCAKPTSSPRRIRFPQSAFLPAKSPMRSSNLRVRASRCTTSSPPVSAPPAHAPRRGSGADSDKDRLHNSQISRNCRATSSIPNSATLLPVPRAGAGATPKCVPGVGAATLWLQRLSLLADLHRVR